MVFVFSILCFEGSIGLVGLGGDGESSLVRMGKS